MCFYEEGPIFSGWSLNAVILSILGSAGGLLVAFTMKYTDAVLKTFATSGAIIVCAVAGYFLLDAPLDIPIGIGATCTVLSLLNYSDSGTPAEPKEERSLSNSTSRQASLVSGRREENDGEESAEPLIDRSSSLRRNEEV